MAFTLPTPARSMKMTVQAFKPDDDALPKDEYQAKWEAFKKLFAKTPEGKSKKVRGRVTRVFGPVPIADIYKGQGKIVSKFIVTFTLNHKGVEGLKIGGQEYTDSLDPKAKYNHLYYAALGEAPEGLEMEVHPGIVGVRDIMIDIKREGPRKDGKQAGFWIKAIDFDPITDDDGNLTPIVVEDYDPIWVEPSAEEWDSYQEMAEASIAAGKRIRRMGGTASRRPGGAPPVKFEELVKREQATIRRTDADIPDVDETDVPWDDNDDEGEK